MSIVLTDQTIDQAEAFRLAKSYRLDPEVALNTDPEAVRFAAFASAYGIDGYPIVLRAYRSRLRRGMMSAIAGSTAAYADRLSHFSDLDAPVSFVDLRSELTESVASSYDNRTGPESDGRKADTAPSIPPPVPIYPRRRRRRRVRRTVGVLDARGAGPGVQRRRAMGVPRAPGAHPALTAACGGQILSKSFPARTGPQTSRCSR